METKSVTIGVLMLVLSLACLTSGAVVVGPPPYKYQFGDPQTGYQEWVDRGMAGDNNNCGPSVNAMVLGYFRGISLSTALDSSPAEARQQECYTQARWQYCEGNGFSGGYTTAYYEYNGSTRVINVLEHEGLSTQLVTGSNVTLQWIEQAIDQGSLVICHVNAGEYHDGGSITHWALAYGYDSSYIYINDPGYSSKKEYPCFRDKFELALENANGGGQEILIIVSEHSLSLVGVYDNGQVCQQIIDCFNRHGGMDGVGWPIDDGGGVFVHNWEPWNYQCQNFRNAEGQESVIIYGAPFCNQAYLVAGDVWDCYRFGYNGRFGPDILLPNGKRLGGPIGEYRNGVQYFENGLYVSKIKAIIGAKSLAKSESAGNAVAVELRQTDGTLVETYYPSGEFSSLTLSGIPVSENQVVLAWLGGPDADHFGVLEDGSQINIVVLPEFTKVGLAPGATHVYQVVAYDSAGNELAVSNEVTLVTPGEPGVITLQCAAEGYRSVYGQVNNTQWPYAPFIGIFRDGMLIRKLAGNAFSDFPLEPNTTYRYQAVIFTASNLVLGYSNEVWVTTDPAPPEPPTPDPVATSVQIQVEPSWLYATDGWATATVFDQYGSEMPGIRVLFFSSDPSIFVASGDNGYCIANNVGTTQVWAEVYDRRWVKSERVAVEVVSELPVIPIQFGSSPLTLDCNFELLSTPPFLEHQLISLRVYLSNPTGQPVTFYGPKGYVFRQDGSLYYGASTYSGTPVTLNPGESGFYVIYNLQLPEAGYCFIQAHTCPTKSMIDADWQVVDQTAAGVSSALWLDVISEFNLKPQLKFLSFEPVASVIYAGEDVLLRVGIINLGDVDINTPFTLTVGVAGLSSQSWEVESLAQGAVYYHTFNLGSLSEGTYKIDGFVDASGVVLEYDESDNQKSTIIEVLPRLLPDLVIADFQVSPVELRVGGQATLSGVASNIDDSDAGACQLLASLGEQTAVIDLPAIPKGQSVPFSQTFGLIALGTLEAQVTVDSGNVVAESYESNNSASITVEVLPLLLPDLAITQFDVASPQYYPDQNPVMLVGLVNPTNIHAGPFRFSLRLAQGNPIATLDFAGLGAGELASFTMSIDPLSVGDWPIVGVVDSAGTVNESNEENNSASSYISVVSRPLCNLVVVSVSPLQPEYYPNQNPQVGVTVGNIGPAASEACSFSLHSVQGNILSQAQIPALSPQGRYSFTLTLSPMSEGTYQVIAAVDQENSVAEESESDNEAVTTISVAPLPQPDLPDLVVSKTDCRLYSWWIFRYASFSATVKNQGKANAGSFRLDVQIPQTGKTYTKTFSGLGVGAQGTYSFTAWSLPKGQVTFRVTADSRAQVQESDESNNYLEVQKTF